MAGCLIANNLTCTRLGRTLFSSLSFRMNPGEALCIQGKNGSGKSSLLKILSGLFSPNSGDIFWNDQGINQHYRNSLIYLGHASGLKTGLTIEENWLSTLAIHQTPSPIAFDTLLDLFQLPKHTRVMNLSAGQQQKTALAKLLFIKKPIWLLDEPETALDADAKKIMMTVMRTHLDKDGILIMSSHESPALSHRALHL